MTDIKKYQLLRYSPSRKEWVLWNEMYDNKKDAHTRVQELAYIYRNIPDMKFKAELVTYNPEKREIQTQLQGLQAVDEKLSSQIEQLKEDPKQEKVNELTDQQKAIKQETAALQARLNELSASKKEE